MIGKKSRSENVQFSIFLTSCFETSSSNLACNYMQQQQRKKTKIKNRKCCSRTNNIGAEKSFIIRSSADAKHCVHHNYDQRKLYHSVNYNQHHYYYYHNHQHQQQDDHNHYYCHLYKEFLQKCWSLVFFYVLT